MMSISVEEFVHNLRLLFSTEFQSPWRGDRQPELLETTRSHRLTAIGRVGRYGMQKYLYFSLSTRVCTDRSSRYVEFIYMSPTYPSCWTPEFELSSVSSTRLYLFLTTSLTCVSQCLLGSQQPDLNLRRILTLRGTTPPHGDPVKASTFDRTCMLNSASEISCWERKYIIQGPFSHPSHTRYLHS